MTRAAQSPAHAAQQAHRIGYAQLNVGCGTDYRQGWVNIDTWRGDGVLPDWQTDIFGLRVNPGTYDCIYAAHVLEHMPLLQVPAALRRMAQLLKPGGELCIVVPDVLGLSAGDAPADWEAVVFGTRTHPGDAHQWVPCAELVLFLCRLARLVGAVEKDLRNEPEFVRGWRIADAASRHQSCIYWRRPY